MTAPSSGSAAAATGSPTGLTHVRADGSAHMVDVSGKPVTVREASAAGRVQVSAAAVAASSPSTTISEKSTT